MSFDKWEIKGHFKSRRCPRRMITADSREWMKLYNHYSKGHLAVAGGVLEQSNPYLEAMSLIKYWIDLENGTRP